MEILAFEGASQIFLRRTGLSGLLFQYFVQQTRQQKIALSEHTNDKDIMNKGGGEKGEGWSRGQ
jgi:hypothetical protein